MADVSVKMGVSGIAQFKQGMKEAEASTKTLDAALKANEKAFKQTGDAENHLAAQTTLLNQKLQQQKNIVKNAEAALKQMRDNGVKESSVQFQNMQRRMIEAQSAMMDTEDQLNHLGEAAIQTAEKTDKLENSLSGLNKKVSLDQVITGIGKITSGLENAAKKAAAVADGIFSSIMDSARWADDTATQAMLLDMSVEKYQQYKGVFDTIGELTVSDWAKAKRKVEKAITDPTADQIDVLRALGFTETVGGKYGTEEIVKIADNWEQAFWDASRALKQKVESGQLSLEQADMLGEALFGRNYSALKPLIELGQTGFQEALGKQNIASAEAIQKDAELNDALIKLKDSYESLKAEVTSGLAPALTTAANALDNLLGEIIKYLQTEEGQAMMDSMAEAVSELFSGLENVSAETVVENFKNVFDTVLGALQWIVDNKDGVVTALEAIFGIWAGLTVSEGVLTVLKVINGLKDLMGIGTGGAAGGAGGGLLTGLGSWLTQAGAKVAEYVGGGGLANFLPAAGDWFMHESPIAPVFSGYESIGDWWERMKREQQERTDTFADNWNPDSENANVIAKGWGEMNKVWKNQVDYWTNIGKQMQAAEEWTFGDEYTADELMAMVQSGNPVPVQVEPEAVEDAAEQIEQQVGTVEVPAQLVVNGFSFGWGQGGGGTGGAGVNMPEEYANGINYVPFDGFPAILHKGERVVPARAMAASRNYSSNLYVESMYMNNGTDAEGLAARMATAQRRTMSSYGQ